MVHRKSQRHERRETRSRATDQAIEEHKDRIGFLENYMLNATIQEILALAPRAKSPAKGSYKGSTGLETEGRLALEGNEV